MYREKKQEEIAAMFDRIAGRYDFLNHLLSLGMDVRWRRKAVSLASVVCKPEAILDVATGTADLAIALMKLKPERISGTDISEAMLEKARIKVAGKGLAGSIELHRAAAESLPFPEGSFDLATSAFGIRNLSDTGAGLREMHRVLKGNGSIVILEFSRPSGMMMRILYGFYFNVLLPAIGRVVSGDRHAYRYLPESVGSFPEGEGFLDLLGEAGFDSLAMKRLSGGIATIYTGKKNSMQ